MGRKCVGAVFGRCHRMAGGGFAYGQPVLERLQAGCRFLALICRETVCGALVGAMLGLLRGSETSIHIRSVLLGAGIGALVGAIVALSYQARAKESVREV